ncbi:CRISPR-associated protein Csx19 [Ruminococcus sp. HUN007]|uniref:type III-D CRISPR-associated protein Csx19 n=1 Tax=Ruminococcus sp. HUN007 TaxID=1514668 RepID=UPI0005D164C1|nr:CRISPR-associated protein Csx19 [Ruminococcus sp. HUN007]
MKLYVKEIRKVKADDIINEVKNQCEGSYIYAMYTDSIKCVTCDDIITDPSKLLEMRIFNADCEIKYSRPDINQEFICRIIDDHCFKSKLESLTDEFEKDFKNRILDDTQFLDIDTTKSSGKTYITTGGGEYSLPIEDAKKLKIRNYIDYSENGIAEITDFRIVSIF